MSKRGSNARFRRETFDAHKRVDARGVYLSCGVCGVRIDPVRGRWTADHIVPLKLGGADDATANGQPLCCLCDDRKTDKTDIPAIAKTKRLSDRHFGVKQRGWYKPPGYKHQWGRRDD